MRKVIFLITVLFVLTMFEVKISHAQWQPDVRLTIDPAPSYTSYTNAWCIASNGNSVHAVWYDDRDGNTEIYYKRSTDGGISWDSDTRLTNNPFFSGYPSVSVSGTVVHVVWHDTRDGNDEIYYKRSPDGGISWGTDTRLSFNSANSGNASVSASASAVHVVWFDDRDGDLEIYGKSSTDGGISWGAEMRLTNNSAGSVFPSVSMSGQVVHVVWYDTRDGNDEIYYKRSTDGGVSWGADIRLTNNSAISYNPSMSVSGLVVHIVWYDNRDGNNEIYHKRSTDGGVSWGADTRLTNNSAFSQFPSVSVSGSIAHVVWEDNRDGNREIYYKRSTDGGVSWGADTRLTNSAANSFLPSVSVSGQVVHVVWHDFRDGNWEIYYKRDPTGNPVGIINTNSDIPEEFDLSQNYPNPFNPNTKISFDIPKTGYVRLKIFDCLGREITTLVNEELDPGTYKVGWDGSNYPSGVYFYTLRAGDYIESKKMILLK